jgi:capsular polysaccharide export protein
VTKVNFNPGDDYFYKNEAIQYKESLLQWPSRLRELLVNREIEAVFLFGDCRAIHKAAKPLCDSLYIDLWCFEEGYLRPNFFTLEKNGVNYNSQLAHISPASLPQLEIKTSLINYPKRFFQMCLAGFQYWLANVMYPNRYPYYTHHRDLNLTKAFYWTRSFLRYLKYKVTERPIRKLIKGSSSASYFVVPLQVHDDSQMTEHSDYQSVEEFIEEVLTSFAEHVKETSSLDTVIIKHHPMDRGHVNYGSFISSLSISLEISSQVVYVHDLALPEIFPCCKGCISNSTSNISTSKCSQSRTITRKYTCVSNDVCCGNSTTYT